MGITDQSHEISERTHLDRPDGDHADPARGASADAKDRLAREPRHQQRLNVPLDPGRTQVGHLQGHPGGQ